MPSGGGRAVPPGLRPRRCEPCRPPSPWVCRVFSPCSGPCGCWWQVVLVLLALAGRRSQAEAVNHSRPLRRGREGSGAHPSPERILCLLGPRPPRSLPPPPPPSLPPRSFYLSERESREKSMLLKPFTASRINSSPPFPNMDKSGSLSQRFIFGAAAPLAGLGTVPPGAELCWCGLRLSLHKFLCSEHNLCLAGGVEQRAGQFGDGIFCRMTWVKSPLCAIDPRNARDARETESGHHRERGAAVCVWSWSMV